MIFVGVFLLWLGCFASYLSSNKQKLIYKSTSKFVAWLGYVIALSLAVFGLTTHFGWLVSILISLLLTMAMWLLLVVLAAHAKERSILVFAIGAAIFPSIFLLGGH
ncbi:hypothetical protein MSG37_07035 [Shewanella sp. 1CM18E]|uniref:hypothetical protein n=1 Tax=Shewanella sp. 1CM18E TaxID=2929169 RepID=UPI0020BEBAE8|nr:hypothetical protein [Shewanella sp. 1CM18E]MCK8044634.1 hypothetical protein [Shewanella sp. 1CM18E]